MVRSYLWLHVIFTDLVNPKYKNRFTFYQQGLPVLEYNFHLVRNVSGYHVSLLLL